MLNLQTNLQTSENQYDLLLDVKMKLLARDDCLPYGKSEEHAIKIVADNTKAGTDKEYTFLRKLDPKYKFLEQKFWTSDLGKFDSISIDSKKGAHLTYIFEISNFFGKH